MSDLYIIRSNRNFHFARAVQMRAEELGYAIEHPSLIEEEGFFFKTDQREQVTDRNSEEDEDEVNLDDFFKTDHYKFRLPPVRIPIVTGSTSYDKKRIATVHSTHILVGCKRVEFEKVKEIYDAMVKLREGEGK